LAHLLMQEFQIMYSRRLEV